MYKFIQRHKKKLLAFFMVMLMIMFIIPAGMNNQGPDTSTQILGKIGDDNFTYGEVEQANRDLEIIKQSRFVGVLARLDPRNPRAMDPMAPPAPMVEQLLENPESYALLQREAKAAGISPNEDEVNTLFTIYFQEGVRTSQEKELYLGLIERFLLVRDNFQRTLADVKVTLPLVRAAVAGQQSPKVNVIEFQASDFESQVPEPTPEQIAAHYQRYATVMPFTFESPTTTQPVQFGYRKGDRLKLQYIELPVNAVMAAAMADLAPAELDAVNRVAAAYFEENQDKFQTTPESKPATTQAGTATAPATAPAQPTTRPFQDVLTEIQPKVLRGEVTAQGAFPEDVQAVAKLRMKVEAKADSIRAALRNRLAGDFEGQRPGLTAGPTTRSADVSKLEYLEKVANDIEKETKVRPIVKSLASEWLTMKELIELPGINTARAGTEDFVTLAVRHAPQATPTTRAATTPSTNPTTGPATNASTQPTTAPANIATEPAKPAMALFEPSPLLRNDAGDAYIFRLIAFEGEHVPTLDEVREQIVKDLKITGAYELARKEAAKVREAAGSSAASPAGVEIGGLPVAAELVGKKVTVAGPISMETRGDIPGLDLKSPTAEDAFLRMTAMLVARATAEQPHPSTIVELASQKKVLVIELRTLEQAWTADQDAQQKLAVIGEERSRLMNHRLVGDALASWFNPEVIAKRVGYDKKAK